MIDRRALWGPAGAGGGRAVCSPQRGEHGNAYRPQPPHGAHLRSRLLEGAYSVQRVSLRGRHPPTALARIEQNVKQTEVHELLQITACKCQELHAPGK